MFSRLFIQNPVLTNVLALIVALLGGVTLLGLPVTLYPNITPPTAVVSASWPGADASTVARVVGSPLEQAVNGLDKVLYLSSKSSDNGDYVLTVTFELGADVDMGTVLLQNRVNSALASLPADVQRQGVAVSKSSPSILMAVALQSPKGSHDSLYLANYATLHIQPVLARTVGVGQANVFGAAQYAMRVWLDTDKMTALGISFDQVNNAIAQQNVQVAAGQIGGEPSAGDQAFQYTVLTQGLLDSPEAFADILVSVQGNGQSVRLGDVATVELGAQSYDMFSRVHSDNAALVAVYQKPGGNALDTGRAINAEMERLARAFPPDVTWSVPFDTTGFVSFAVHQVYGTFFSATLLVVAVVFLFLQTWRATLGPAVVIPVTLLGAFCVMGLLGFSVNIITLFALVLAIGLVVDDAIIVVEATMRHLEAGKPPREAALLGMQDLFLSIVAVTLVFASVFLPAATLGGISGELYRQFALVIGGTALISALFALTLNPTECALWLRPPAVQSVPQRDYFKYFNKAYNALQQGVLKVTAWALRCPLWALFLYVAVAGCAVWGYARLPGGFLPQEDQGYLLVSAQLPDAAALPRTQRFARELEQRFARVEGVQDWVIMGGTSLLTGASASNALTAFVIFESFQQRGTRLSEGVITKALQQELGTLPEGEILVIPPPPIMGIGNAGGFDLMVEDRNSAGPVALEQAVRQLEAAARARSEVQGVLSLYSASTPKRFIAVDRAAAMNLHLPLSNVFEAMQTAFGGKYINQFSLFDRNFQVQVQAAPKFRATSAALTALHVRNSQGQEVPMGAIATTLDTVGPSLVTRYNLYPAASVQGEPAAGTSSGLAMNVMEQLADEVLPPGFGTEWTTMALQEQLTQGQTPKIIGLAVLLVYLILTALYANWILPLSVLLVIPLAVSGSVGAIWLRGMDSNVYVQIGMLLLVAMASKNALILVQYARQYHAGGMSLVDAAQKAASVRFRPIFMSSLAFAAGSLPLLWATGAGATSQRYLGTTVFGGMLATGLLTAVYAPLFFVGCMKMVRSKTKD